MADEFDPYLSWLGIRDKRRPPTHYRLLGLEAFESDGEVIANAADRQMAHVRTFQASKYSEYSQKLLNELAQAKLCLLNAGKKQAYDAQLRAEQAAMAPAPLPPVPAAPAAAPPAAVPPRAKPATVKPVAARPVASVLPVDDEPARPRDEPSNPFLAPAINTDPVKKQPAGGRPVALYAVVVVVVLLLAGGGAWVAFQGASQQPIAIETPVEPEPEKKEEAPPEKKTEVVEPMPEPAPKEDTKQKEDPAPEPAVRLLPVEDPEPAPEEVRPPAGQVLRFAGHKGRVTALATSGDYVLSAGADRLLRLWSLEDGRGRKFARLRDEVLTISLEDARALVGTADGGLLIYDLAERRNIGQLTGHRGAIYAALWLPGGEQVVSAGRDGTVRLWDVRERKEQTKLRAEGAAVTCLAASRDGLRVAAGTQDGRVLAWNLGSDNAETRVYRHDPADRSPPPVTNVALSPDGVLLAFALRGQPTRVYQLAAEAEGPTLEHEEPLTSLAFAAASVVLGANSQGQVRLWNAEDGKPVARFETGESGVLCTALAGDRGALTGSLDGSIRLWELPIARRSTRPETGVLHQLAGHKGEIRAVAFSADGARAITAGLDDQARLWDVKEGEEKGVLGPHPGGAHSAAFFPSGELAITGGEDGQLRVWNLSSHTLSRTLAGHAGPVTRISLNADGDKAVSFDREQNAQHWEMPSGVKLASFTGVARGDVWDASFDSQLAVSAGYARRLRVWRLEDGKSPRTATLKQSWVTSVSLAPGGTQAATTGEDGVVRIWLVEAARETRRFAGHNGPVWAVGWSPDGKLLITGGQDKTVRVWDVATGREVSRFTQHEAPVTAVALAKGNLLALSGDKRGQAIVWALPTLETQDADPSTFVKAGELPTPPEKAVAAPVEAEVKKQFKNEYARRQPAEKLAFAQLLFDAGKAEADPTMRYVLLNESRDQASAAGDVGKTFEAIDALERTFTLDALQLRVDALTEAVRTAKSAEQTGTLLRQALAQSDAACNAWRYDVALKFTAIANTAAGKLNVPLVSAYTAYRDKNVRFLKNEYDRLKKSFDRLAEEPADPEANLQVAKVLCYSQGAWADGLRMLALSGDPKLSRLADRELRRPADAAGLRDLGRGWWEAANDETKPPYKLALQIRGYERTRDAKLVADGDFLKVLDEQLADMLKTLAPRALQFLSNLPEAEVLVGYGTFGKNGLLGYDSKGVRRISVQGNFSPKGLSMFPPEDGSSHVAYGTFGQFRTFHAKAAIADTAQQAEPDRPLTFTVLGDGKELWSGQVGRRGEAIDVSCDVTGIDKLELVVSCRGANTGCQAVWLEPRLWPFLVD